jgi:hypothetical protein
MAFVTGSGHGLNFLKMALSLLPGTSHNLLKKDLSLPSLSLKETKKLRLGTSPLLLGWISFQECTACPSMPYPKLMDPIYEWLQITVLAIFL